MRQQMPSIHHRFSDDNMLKLFWKYAVEEKELEQKPYSSKDVILFRLDLIGDCIMFSDTLRAICDHYKDGTVTVVCLPKTAPVFQRLNICKVHPINLSTVIPSAEQLEEIIQELRQKEYDMLLQPQEARCPFSDVLAAGVKANRRIALECMNNVEPRGGNSLDEWIQMANGIYDEIIPAHHGFESVFDNFGEFARGLGIRNFKTSRPRLPFGPQHWVEGEYYAIVPGGTAAQKYWPTDRFAKIADHIFEKTGLRGVIIGVEGEKWIAEKLLRHVKPETAEALIDLTGKTNTFEMFDLIGNAKMCVSNDTAGVHVACATNVPCVATVGGWYRGEFLPYHLENIQLGDHLPRVAYAEGPCQFCSLKVNYMFEKNPKCLRRFLMGATAVCIDEIPYEQVRDLVDQCLEEL